MKTDKPKHPAPSCARLLSIADVARILGVSRRTVYRYIKDGLLPSFVVGRKARRFRDSAVEEFIHRCEAGNSGPVAEPPRQLNLGLVEAQKRKSHARNEKSHG